MRPFLQGFANELVKTASPAVRSMQKRADAQSDLSHYEARARGTEPRRPTPQPPQGSMQGGTMKYIKPPPAPKVRGTVDMQRGAADLDGPDVTPPTPKPIAKPAMKPPAKPARVAGA